MTRALRFFAAGAALLVVPTIARAQEGAREAPAYDAKALDAPKPFAEFSRSAMTLRDSLVALARAQVGTKYVHGGETPTRGFDCSGLVRYIVAALHIVVPRTAARQAFTGVEVPKDTSQMLPGDLVTFGRGKSAVSHIGIYVGNGRIVHASTKAGEVIETDLLKPKVAGPKRWRGTRRVLTEDGMSVAAGDSVS
ncbi:MAG: C40 family peptidase [Gemmatimonadaceae bacterium]|nr:C40 family peptidase [Gemmatimonadaceae bacterium]